MIITLVVFSVFAKQYAKDDKLLFGYNVQEWGNDFVEAAMAQTGNSSAILYYTPTQSLGNKKAWDFISKAKRVQLKICIAPYKVAYSVTFLAIEMRNMCSSVNPSSLPTVVAHALRTADVVTHHDMAARTSMTTTRMFGRVTNLPSNNNVSGFASQKVQVAQQHLHTKQYLHTPATVRACHTTDGFTVPVSTVFDCFRELKMPRLQSNYVTHTGAERAISFQLPLPIVNHAYLCLDLINYTIRHEIVTFSNNNKEKRRTSHLNAGLT
ncbi:hypothetical protein Tco_1508213 [Tanacetum coccineum]